MSVWGYFTSELTRGYLLEREEEKYAQKRQRVYTFMKTPRELEKFSTYGFFQCLDAFLFIFTFLPLRILLAIINLFTVPCGFIRSRKVLEPAQICDILKGVILIVCSFIMSHIDTSMMYHLVRGQATIKLYVFFNMLDMADRLLSNFGHDILDALFWTATEPRGRKREHLGTLPHLLIAIVYVIIHTLLILFQATVLNVAFNSHNKSLLVIMMSNNFVEIKSNLFKKVDVSHLYQIACSDVKERFQYVILLAVVCIRNMNEVAWNLEHLWVLLPDAIMVLISEIFVDWGKHAFILKFNEIPADVYGEFKVKLALDMATSRQSSVIYDQNATSADPDQTAWIWSYIRKNAYIWRKGLIWLAFTDHSDLVSRRMGLTPLPLACLLYRILSKSVRVSTYLHYAILFVLYLCLMSFKVLNSIILLGHSYKVIEQYQEENQSESPTNQEQDNKDNQEPANQNHATADCDTKSPFKKFYEKSASFDAKVCRSSSQIFAADSYVDLTMVPVEKQIEQTGCFELKNLHKTADSELNVETIPNNHDSLLKDIDNGDTIEDHNKVSSDQCHESCAADDRSHDHKKMPCDQSHDENMAEGDSKTSKKSHSSSFHGATIFQRSPKSFFMHFGAAKKFGSSASLPETVGECSEIEELQPAANSSEKSGITKFEKAE